LTAEIIGLFFLAELLQFIFLPLLPLGEKRKKDELVQKFLAKKNKLNEKNKIYPHWYAYIIYKYIYVLFIGIYIF